MRAPAFRLAEAAVAGGAALASAEEALEGRCDGHADDREHRETSE